MYTVCNKGSMPNICKELLKIIDKKGIKEQFVEDTYLHNTRVKRQMLLTRETQFKGTVFILPAMAFGVNKVLGNESHAHSTGPRVHNGHVQLHCEGQFGGVCLRMTYTYVQAQKYAF